MPSAPSTGRDRDFYRVVWLTLALFLSYLSVAMALPVTSVFVATRLELGNALAGLAVGIAFGSTILTRAMAGRMADRQGGKRCMVRGLSLYVVTGVMCGAASLPGFSALAAYGVLIAGRLLLGVGESMTMIGLLAWGFGILGPQRSGMVLSLVGMGLYGAFALGGPIGLAVFDRLGLAGMMLICALLPLVGLAMVLPLAATAPHAGDRPSFWSIIGRIWQPGLVVGLQAGEH